METTTVCQIASCTNPKFTYCPHCSLHICIKCLNEHYSLMETNYKQELIHFREELNKNRFYYIDQQEKLSNELYNYALNQFHSFENFLSDKMNHDGLSLLKKTFHPYQYIELQEQINLFVKTRRNFDQLLTHIHDLILNFQQNSSKTKSSTNLSTVSEDMHLDSKPSMTITIDSDDDIEDDDDNDNDDESNMEASAIGTLKTFIENRLSNVSPANNQVSHLSTSPIKREPPRTYSAKELRGMYHACPLTQYTFGLQEHHCHSNGIAHIPCRRRMSAKSTLFMHLNRYHLLNTQASLKIIGAVVYFPDQLDKIDLFSTEGSNSIGGNVLLAFTARCPLTKYGVYGVLPEHEIKICDKSQTSKKLLHYHLRRYHKISHPFATRIVRAVMNNVEHSTQLIKSDEIILREN